MTKMNKLALVAFAIVGICVGCSSSPETPVAGSPTSTGATTTGTTVAYADIQEVFDKNCVKCHGAENPKEGYSLVSHEALMKGGEDGPAVVPGDPENSLLIHVLRGSHGKKQMPFGMAPLPEAEIQKVEAWIKDGAKA